MSKRYVVRVKGFRKIDGTEYKAGAIFPYNPANAIHRRLLLAEYLTVDNAPAGPGKRAKKAS